MLRQASRAAEERENGQESLFGGIAGRPMPASPRARHCRSSPDWPPVERLQNEFDAIGFYLSSHPLDPYGKSLERAGILRWADLPAALAASGTTRFRLAGIVVGKKERTSARGSRFAFVQLSDTSGVFEVTVFSEVLAQARALFDGGQPLIVTVDVRREDESLRLTAQKIEPLDSVVAHAAAGLRVFVGEAEALPRLKSLFGREAGGRPRPGHRRARPAEQRGRDRAARRLPRRPAHPRRGQVAARHRRRARYLRRLQPPLPSSGRPSVVAARRRSPSSEASGRSRRSANSR